MIREYMHEKTGIVYATSDEWEATVDEVIAFLEKHRGKKFWNGATGEVSFRADDKCVSTDELDFWMDNDLWDEQINGWDVCELVYEYLKNDGDYPDFDADPDAEE